MNFELLPIQKRERKNESDLHYILHLTQLICITFYFWLTLHSTDIWLPSNFELSPSRKKERTKERKKERKKEITLKFDLHPTRVFSFHQVGRHWLKKKWKKEWIKETILKFTFHQTRMSSFHQVDRKKERKKVFLRPTQCRARCTSQRTCSHRSKTKQTWHNALDACTCWAQGFVAYCQVIWTQFPLRAFLSLVCIYAQSNLLLFVCTDVWVRAGHGTACWVHACLWGRMPTYMCSGGGACMFLQ